MTRLVGIFGYPLAHSISPAFQQAAFDYYSLDVTYQAWPLPPHLLEEKIAALRGGDYLGANVTIPHKETVAAILDEVDPQARSVGAVNTIVRKGSQLVGYNTDFHGFLQALRQGTGFKSEGSHVLLLGAGGAARAAAFGLAEEGVASLIIANRNIHRAESLAYDVGNILRNVTAVALDQDALATACLGVNLIVNSTSVGMKHGNACAQTPLPGSLIPSGALVYDMVYNPAETRLIREARNAGASVLGGLPMLVYQGAAAFEHWTGKAAPVEVMFRAAERALIT